MSIVDEIASAEASGKLIRFAPKSRRPLVRRLFLAQEAFKDLDDPQSATNIMTGRGHIIAALERWVRGGQIYADNGKGRFLKRLDGPPPEIWEIRVTQPVVNARLFGRFAYASTLILTNFHTRPYLGPKYVKGKPSAKWIKAMESCEDSWNNLFPCTPPMAGNTVHAYITENCDDFHL